MNDLIDRLDTIRCYAEWNSESETAEQAISELERLAEENKKLKDALRKIGKTGHEKFGCLTVISLLAN